MIHGATARKPFCGFWPIHPLMPSSATGSVLVGRPRIELLPVERDLEKVAGHRSGNVVLEALVLGQVAEPALREDVGLPLRVVEPHALNASDWISMCACRAASGR
jgi:hypothetical protein